MTGGLEPRYIYGFICTNEKIEAVQRDATSDEVQAIERYRLRYKEEFDRFPHGLHYIELPNDADTVAIWFAPVD